MAFKMMALEDESDLSFSKIAPSLFLEAANVLATKANLPLAWLFQGRKKVKEGALPTSALADDRIESARLERKGDILK